MSTTNTLTKVVAATPHTALYSAILARLINANWGEDASPTEVELHEYLAQISQYGAFGGVEGFVRDDELAEFFDAHLSEKEAFICELQDGDENFSTDVWEHSPLVRAMLFAEPEEVRELQKRMKARVVILLLEQVVEEYMLACEKE
jgi:hypothetical protein